MTIAFILALVATGVPVHGEVRLALPEGGLYRPGQYLSVAITGAAGADEIRIEADGALPTRIHRPADRVVAPLLVVDSNLANLRVIADGAVLHHDGPLRLAPPEAPLAGPAGSLISEYAYYPTFGWRPGWPGHIRLGVLGLAIMLAILLIAASLPRGRRLSMAAIAIVLAAGIAAAWALPAVYPAVHGAQGMVMIRDGQRMQADRWSFQTSRRPQPAAFRWQDSTYPIFFSRQHRDDLQMELRAASDGSPLAFAYRLPAGGSIAFLSRTISADAASETLSDGSPNAGAPTRLRDLALRIYRRPIRATLPSPADAGDWFGGVELVPPESAAPPPRPSRDISASPAGHRTRTGR